MKLATLALALIVAALPVASIAQDVTTSGDEQILLKQIQTDKRAVYAEYLKLTDDESKAFWPIYDQYEVQRKKVDDRTLALLNDFANKYDTLTDADASQMLKEWLAIETRRVDLKVKYTNKIANVLPSKKALRFAQLESRIDNLMRRNLSSIVPLAR